MGSMGSSPVVPFVVVHEEPHDCPYLPGQTALTPLRLPRRRLARGQFDDLLAEGDRRAGVVVYRTACPTCHACEALRIPVARFKPSKSQRRSARKNAEDVRVEVVEPLATPDRVALYNKHRMMRDLATDGAPITNEEYRFQYVSSCVDTREIDYFVGDRLIGVSLLDVGATSASSVYHYFDPDEGRRSLGVFSVVHEIELCAEWGLDWYYLGLWVEASTALRYKSGYYPHQRLRDGVWTEYAGDGEGTRASST